MGGRGGDPQAGTSPRLLQIGDLKPTWKARPGDHPEAQPPRTGCVSVCVCDCMHEKSFMWMEVCLKDTDVNTLPEA